MNIINFQLMQNVIINQTVVMCDIKKIATEQLLLCLNVFIQILFDEVGSHQREKHKCHQKRSSSKD